MKNNKKETKTITLPSFKFFWKKNKKEKFFTRPVSSAQVLINGKLIVFVFCSLVSAFINLVFISNLTKSDYSIGTLISVPAAVLLGMLSVGLDIGKFLLAIQVNTLGELIRKLSKFSWVKRVKRAAIWWRSVYITFILLSVITSVSLSTISIGAGISRNANLIKQIDEYTLQGEQYAGINDAAKTVNMQNLISKATDTSEKDAINYAREQMNRITPEIESYKADRDEFEGLGYSVASKELVSFHGSDIVPNDYWDKRNRQLNILLQNAGYTSGSLSGVQLKNLSPTSVEKRIKDNKFNNSKTASTDEANAKLNDLTNTSNLEVMSWLETLNALNLINPKTNELVQFDTTVDKPAMVLAKSALIILKALRVDVENDSGDIGSSSKLFMQLGSAWEAKHAGDKDLQAVLAVKSEGSFGATEVMMMGMLLFLSLLCELLINLFSPKTNISRKMLSQFSEYFDNNFDVNDFMLEIYLDQLNFGTLDREIFDLKSKKAVELTEITKASLYEKYRRKEKNVPSEVVKPVIQKEEKIETQKPVEEKEILPPEPVVETPISEPKESLKESSEEAEIETSEGFSSKVDEAIQEIESILKKE